LDYTGSFAATKNGDRNYLGKTVALADTNDREFHGQMDEVRFWKVALTEEQIRANMFQRLTGKEANLVGLWNFDDVQSGVVKDLSPGKHDGKLMGNAKVVQAQLPKGSQSGVVSKVLQLDGESSIETDAVVIPTAGDYTVECWAFANDSARGEMRHLVAQ